MNKHERKTTIKRCKHKFNTRKFNTLFHVLLDSVETLKNHAINTETRFRLSLSDNNPTGSQYTAMCFEFERQVELVVFSHKFGSSIFELRSCEDAIRGTAFEYVATTVKDKFDKWSTKVGNSY